VAPCPGRKALPRSHRSRSADGRRSRWGQRPNKVTALLLTLQTGTGAGVWALDFADRHSLALAIIGVDVEANEAKEAAQAPPNVYFEVEDFTDKWPFGSNMYDYIHIRGLSGRVSDWRTLYERIYDSLIPGTYFEHAEISTRIRSQDGSDMAAPMLHLRSVHGRDEFGDTAEVAVEAEVAENLEESMRATGFHDVTCHTFMLPIGPWPQDERLKEIGELNRTAWASGIEGYDMLVQGYEFRPLVRFELEKPSIHAYQLM
jgi:hypothetical protein